MYLGIDLGTSGVKAIVIDDAQRVLGEATSPLTVSRPAPAQVEQDPADWIGATMAALAELACRTPLDAVRGIGLSGQMHGAVLLGADGRPLRPCMLWNDTRAAVQAREMDATEPWRQVSGNIVFAGFTAPKVAWVREHEADIFARIAKVLLPKDYLRLWLTQSDATDMSDAAGTSWLDTGARDWSDAALAASGLSRAQMPELVEGSHVSGHLRADLAADLGLPPGIPVAGGGGDNAATGIGMGAVRAGDGFVSLGTSGVLFVANDSYRPDPETAVHTFCHAVPQAWHQMGVILAATDALNWFAALVGQDASHLTRDLGPLQAPGETVFLPYLGGERTPLNDTAIRGAFVGLRHATDRAAATRAVLEGVAFALRDCRDALRATGTEIGSLLATGGGARSDYWLTAIASALDTPIAVPAAGDFGAAFGAARLGLMAAEGAGVEIAKPPPTARQIYPDADLIESFTDGHARYRAAGAAIKGLT